MIIDPIGSGGARKAEKVKYNNSTSKLSATDVQGAIDEVNDDIVSSNSNLQSQINTVNSNLDVTNSNLQSQINTVNSNLDATNSNLQSQINRNSKYNRYSSTNTGYSTLREFLINEIFGKSDSSFCIFAAGSFSDLPITSGWDFTIIAYNTKGAMHVYAYKFLSNNEIYVRDTNASGNWNDDWQRLILESDINSINTEISNLKKSVSDGKASVVSAITQMLTGVMGATPDSLATDASFSDISNYLTSKQLNLRANDSKIFTSSTEDTVFFPKTNKVYAFITMCAKSTSTKDISLYITTSDGQHPEATCLQSWDGLANSSVAVSNRLYLIENCKDATVNIEFSGSVNVTGTLTVFSMLQE